MAINTTTNNSDLLDTAIKKGFELGFAPNGVFSQLSQDKEVQSLNAGDTAKFTIFNQLNPATAVLPETTDPTAKTLSQGVKTVTLREYGDLITSTQKLRLTSIENLDLATISLVGASAGESTDILARTTLDAQVGSEYVTYVGQTSKSAITATDIMTDTVVETAYNKLSRKNVSKLFGNNYALVVHPDVASDIKDDNAFVDVVKYSSSGLTSILNGEIGTYKGFKIIENSNALLEYGEGSNSTATTVVGIEPIGETVIAVTSGTGFAIGDIVNITTSGDTYSYPVTNVAGNNITIGACIGLNGNIYRTETAGLVVATTATDPFAMGVSVYTSYAVGYQAIGYAYAMKPELVISERADALLRLANVGWKSLHGFGELRVDALHKIFSASSRGFNG